MIVTQDERTAARFEACYPVQIEANGRPIPGRSVNLGIGGLCLEPGLELPDHTPVVCRVDPEGGPLEAQGEVAWQYAEDGVYRMGIKFCALTPAMAGWLSSVSAKRLVSDAAPAPVSDTQPMKVPVSAEYPEGTDVAIPQAPTFAPPTAHILATGAVPLEQLDLWKKKKVAAPPAAPIVLTAPEGGEAVETEILFDDMPSPEARMMQTKPETRGAAVTSAKDRVAAVLASARGTLVRVSGAVTEPIARLRARRAKASRTAPTERLPAQRAQAPAAARAQSVGARVRVAALLSSARSITARLPAVTTHLGNRRVQLIAAVVATLALVISGIAFLFSADTAGGDIEQAAALPVAAEDTGSYWDPPVMPVPDQALAEAAPVPPAEPEPSQAAAPRHEPPPVAIPDMPLPEPPVVGAQDEMPAAEAVAALPAVPPELTEGTDEAPVTARAEPRTARERRAERRASRAEARRAERPRETRAEARRAERTEHSVRSEDRPARAEAARADERTASVRARREPEAPTRTRASADRNAHRAEPRAAPAAATPGHTTFRLNLSGTPGAISTYPLANPNGIVIDVANLQHPGEATKLTSDDPRIRFVKIINREQGVRFIVYLTGALPEYKIEPSGRGIRVALEE